MQMFPNFGISCGKETPQFSAVASQINLRLIHILQNVMEDFHFHQFHSLLFVIIKIKKRNKESTDLDRSGLSDSTATSAVVSARHIGL